jgi:hypothetical protein
VDSAEVNALRGASGTGIGSCMVSRPESPTIAKTKEASVSLPKNSFQE